VKTHGIEVSRALRSSGVYSEWVC